MSSPMPTCVLTAIRERMERESGYRTVSRLEGEAAKEDRKLLLAEVDRLRKAERYLIRSVELLQAKP